MVAALTVAGGVGAGERAWGQGSEKIPSFNPPVTFDTIGFHPYGLAAGDVTGPEGVPDGYPDVVVANGGFDLGSFTPIDEGSVTIYRNSGDWSFPAFGLQHSQTIPFPHSSPRRVVFADMTGNGVPDLVVSAGMPDQWNQGQDDTWGVYVFINNNGSFSLKSHVETPMPVSGLAVADFDNDGLNDVAVCVDWTLLTNGAGESDFVYVLQNDPSDPGRLILKPSISLNMGGYPDFDTPTSLLAGDFNKTFGPPKQDIVTVHWIWGNPTAVSVLTGQGNWLFSLANRDSPCSGWPYEFHDAVSGRFAMGSLSLDIAARKDNGPVYILHGNSQGNFNLDCSMPSSSDVYKVIKSQCLASEPPVSIRGGLAVGHLNGGTKPDLVATVPSNDNSSYVTMFLGKGDGTFQIDYCDPRHFVTVGAWHPIQVLCVDLNQDGFDDIVTANYAAPITDPHTISVLINKMLVIGEPE